MTQGAGPDPSERPAAGVAPPEHTATGGATSEAPVPFTFAPTVTLFFSDIRGFTEYTDAHGDAAAFRMLQYHNTMVQEQIALYGGHIVKTLGDSYMVSFNAARNAMTCGIGIQKSLAQYNEKEVGARIHIGIGINMGEPILDADDFFGGSVNLAARICAAAGPGEILVSEGVRHVVGKMEGTDYIDRGQFDLKGFQEPQHLYAVDWSGLGTTTGISPATPARTPASSANNATTVPTPTAPGRSSRRLPIVIGAVAVVLVLLGGAFLALRASGFGPFGGRPAVKPTQVVGNPSTNNTAAAGNTAPAAASPPAAKPAAKPAQAAASPAIGDTATAASPPAAKPAQATKPAAGPPLPASAGRLLFADDFSDPSRGLFRNNLEGIGRITGDGTTPLDFQGNYSYRGGALVGRLVGDHPGGERYVFGRMLLAGEPIREDFAAEVRARITISPNVTRFGLQYAISPNEFFTFTIYPGTTGFNMSRTFNQQAQILTAGRTPATRPPREDNLLRIEIRGDTARLFVNGQEAGLARHETLAKRGGQIGLNMAAMGQLADRTAEVEFRDLKVFALAP